MLQLDAKRMVTVCSGAGQTGKSTFSIRYMLNAELTARYVFDPEGEYSQRLGIPSVSDAYGLSLALCRGWIIFDPHQLFAGRMNEALQFFCEFAFETSSILPGLKLLNVDEVWKYCSSQAIPQELANVCQTGRKRGLGLMVNTQLPTALNRSLLAEVSEFVSFRLQYDQALELLQRRGFDAAEIQSLPDLHFVSRTDQGAQCRGAIEI